jgi:DNA-binding response OmpR family regulator
VFRIHLPRAGAEAEPALPGPESPERPRGSETILLVEDEAQVRALARRVLAGSGYTVLEAESGEDALRLLREHGGPVHLLLTDVVMPGMSGPEVARRVGDARPGVRVLYMSGYTDEKLSAADLRRGGLLLKPFSMDELVRRVRAAIDAPPG